MNKFASNCRYLRAAQAEGSSAWENYSKVKVAWLSFLPCSIPAWFCVRNDWSGSGRHLKKYNETTSIFITSGIGSCQRRILMNSTPPATATSQTPSSSSPTQLVIATLDEMPEGNKKAVLMPSASEWFNCRNKYLQASVTVWQGRDWG